MIGKVVQGFSSSFPDVGNHQLGIVMLNIYSIIGIIFIITITYYYLNFLLLLNYY